MNFQSVLTQQQHQYAMQQSRRSNTPSSTNTNSIRSSLPPTTNVHRSSSSAMNGGHVQGNDYRSSGASPSTGGGSFVTKIRQAPSKLSSNGNNGSSSSDATPTNSPTTKSSNIGGLLTQANNTVTKPTTNANKNTSGSDMEPLNSSGKWAVNERRLAQWQQQPYNLSPATHLNLEPMLPPPRPELKQKPLLVLDVDETLVHASFTPAKPFHVKITINVDGETGDIFVAYRPHLFTFLDAILPLFEVAIFTASQSCYADQLMDAIDPQGRLGRLRLFREHCTEVNGARVKDLSLLGRPLHRIALIDNSPVTYLFQPRNAIPILSWFDDPRDTELLKMLPMLRQLAQTPSVYDVLDLWNCSSQR
jgi:Dullard-like phosphatase family protein